MTTANRLAWIALNSVPGIGPVLSHRLSQALGSAAAVFQTPAEQLAQCPGVRPEVADRIAAFRWQEAAHKELDGCAAAACRLFTLDDPEYPGPLRQIDCPPPVLYVRGEWTPADARALAVVGSRTPSHYGLAACRSLATGLAEAGYTVVSGLARGIDAAAHAAALDAGGRTIAVLAHGLACPVYPRENRKLHESIVRQGAAVSEFPLAMPPVAMNFPRRNRIISGLAQGVLVVEAGAKSGSLITARWAAEQGREVFAVPGQFNAPLSQGAHALIQDGAKLVTRLEDILEEIVSEKRPAPAAAPAAKLLALSEIQAKIMQALDNTALHIDQLAQASGQPVATLLSELLGLEIQGLVVSSPGQRYQKAA